MVAFNLPRNSRISQGQTFKAPSGAKRVREFKIYRWSPDNEQNPHTDTY
jgi:succinate dehydrogenase / fumarate reductase iron-sulfur subunit